MRDRIRVTPCPRLPAVGRFRYVGYGAATQVNRVVGRDDLLIAPAAPAGHNVSDGGVRPAPVWRRKGEDQLGTYLQDMMQNRGTASSQFKDYSGRGPSVVVQNAFGENGSLQ